MAHSPSRFTHLHARARLALPLIVLAIAAFLRFASLEHFSMLYDEHITRAVVENIWTGDLRNNWKYANVPTEFKRDLFNFSSYMYADALVAGPHPKNPVRRERALSAALGTIGLAFFYVVASELFSPAIALAALAIGAVFPLLVQDSHYARPESFVLALSGLVYLLSVRMLKTSRLLLLLAASSFCCGLLIACKVSLIPVAFVPLACVWRREQRFNLKNTAVCAMFVVIGTFAGVPGAFFEPHAFLSGIAFLRNEYANELLPHSLIDSHYCYRLLFPYFWQTAGAPFCILLLAGALVLIARKDILSSAILTFPVLFYVFYFAFQRTFFERNLSHVIPVAAILCAIAIDWLADRFHSRLLFILLLAAVLFQPAFVSTKLVLVAMRTTSEERAEQYEKQLQAREGVLIIPGIDLHTAADLQATLDAASHSPGPFIMRSHDFNDAYTERGFRQLQNLLNAREVGRFPSLFAGLVPSTLYVYHSPAFRYIRITPKRVHP